MGRVPERCRNRRSFRQWADLLAISRVRTLRPAGFRFHCMPKACGHGLQGRLQLGLGSGRGGLHPHEEGAGGLAAVLLGVRNIAARHEQGAGDGMDDSGPVRAGQGQDVGGELVSSVTKNSLPAPGRPRSFW